VGSGKFLVFKSNFYSSDLVIRKGAGNFLWMQWIFCPNVPKFALKFFATNFLRTNFLQLLVDYMFVQTL